MPRQKVGAPARHPNQQALSAAVRARNQVFLAVYRWRMRVSGWLRRRRTRAGRRASQREREEAESRVLQYRDFLSDEDFEAESSAGSNDGEDERAQRQEERRRVQEMFANLLGPPPEREIAPGTPPRRSEGGVESPESRSSRP